LRLRSPALDPLVLVPKPIDNSRVVREVDPRARRDLRSVLALVLALVIAMALYAWPGLELRRTGLDIVRLNREREQLIERNRKLRLEKASLEQLQRIETLAQRELNLVTPPAERVIVILPARPLSPDARLADGGAVEEIPN
jgi:cell division protein FtsL